MPHITNAETLITYLDRLGLMYHTYFGFRPLDEKSNYAEDYIHDLTEDQMIWYHDHTDASIVTEKGVKIENLKTLNDAQESGEEIIVCCDLDALHRVSITTLSFDKIILKYREDNWYGKDELKEWYNSDPAWWRRVKEGETNPYLRTYILPYLKSRSYITVDDPFMQVSISAEQKGTLLNIDDILFATRALAVDATRTYTSYSLIDYDEDTNTLTLEPDMDNYST